MSETNASRLTGYSREGAVSRAEQIRLEALEKARAEGVATFEIDTDLVDANPYQPRIDFSAVEEMAVNLRAQGQLYPILVRRQGDRYQVADGETRLRAIRLNAERHGVPAIVKAVLADYDDRQMAFVAFSSVYHRKDLNPIEEARGLRRLHDELDVTYETLAEYFGRTKSYFVERVRLLNLDTRLQDLVQEGKLTPAHAITLKRVPQADLERVTAQVIDQQLSVHETREAVKAKPLVAPAVVEAPRSRKENQKRTDLWAELEAIWDNLPTHGCQALLVHARRMVEELHR